MDESGLDEQRGHDVLSIGPDNAAPAAQDPLCRVLHFVGMPRQLDGQRRRAHKRARDEHKGARFEGVVPARQLM